MPLLRLHKHIAILVIGVTYAHLGKDYLLPLAAFLDPSSTMKASGISGSRLSGQIQVKSSKSLVLSVSIFLKENFKQFLPLLFTHSFYNTVRNNPPVDRNNPQYFA